MVKLPVDDDGEPGRAGPARARVTAPRADSRATAPPWRPKGHVSFSFFVFRARYRVACKGAPRCCDSWLELWHGRSREGRLRQRGRHGGGLWRAQACVACPIPLTSFSLSLSSLPSLLFIFSFSRASAKKRPKGFAVVSKSSRRKERPSLTRYRGKSGKLQSEWTMVQYWLPTLRRRVPFRGAWPAGMYVLWAIVVRFMATMPTILHTSRESTLSNFYEIGA